MRGILRIAALSSGSSGLNSVGLLTLMVAAGQVPGGAVAFQIASNFFNLPIALCARPIASAQLPLLSGHHGRGAAGDFHATYRYSLRLALLIALPASLVFVGVPELLARCVAMGDMRTPEAIALIAAAISGLGLGIVAESAFVVSTSAAYARHDAASPLQAMMIRLAVLLCGVALAPSAGRDDLTLWHLGLAGAAASIAAALYLYWRLVRRPGIGRALPRAEPPATGAEPGAPA